MKRAIIILGLFFLTNVIVGQNIVDKKWGFKINIPPSWSQKNHMDGNDKVFDYTSPDQNTAVQLRVFEATPQVTVDLLCQAYESSYLPAGTQKESLVDYTTVNGIPGKQGLYTLNYNNTEVKIASFYTVQNNIGYVLNAVIPASMIAQKGEELKQITHSFLIDGFEAATNGEYQNQKPRDLSGNGSVSSTNSTSFEIIDIKLSDQLDANNKAINPKVSFNPKSQEISAVIEYVGVTSADLFVSWIYKKSDITIIREAYNFTDKNGGIGVVSITKPNDDWPVGNYSVKFEMNGEIIQEVDFKVTEQLGGARNNEGVRSYNIAGKYNFISRSDGKNMTNYHYIIINENGSYTEKYQPKNSGNYVGGNEGTWKLNGDQLTLHHKSSTVVDTYKVNNNSISRTTDSGIVFTFQTSNTNNTPQTTSGNQTTPANNSKSSENTTQIEPSSIQINKLELGSEIDSNHGVVENATIFPVNTKRFNLVFDYAGNANGKLFLVKWFSETHQCLITEAQYLPVNSGDSRGHAFIENNNKLWPIGAYRAEIWFEGKRIKEQKFTVQNKQETKKTEGVLLGKIYADGTGDNRTKSKGGKYIGVDLNKLKDNDIIEIRITSGDLKFVHVHLRSSTGMWDSKYNGMNTRFKVKDLITNQRKSYTHLNFNVNAKHERYLPVACYAEVWHIPAKDNEASVENTKTQKPVQISSSSGNIKQIILDNQNFGYDFASGKLRNSHKPDPDVLNEPWCTDLPALCGNWAKTGKSRMQDVTAAPTSGYISDDAGYGDCQQVNLNEVLVFKLKDGTYAKFMIIKDEKSKVNDECQHRVTCLVEYPAFVAAQSNQQTNPSQNNQSSGFWPHTARLASDQPNQKNNTTGFRRFNDYGVLSFEVPENWEKKNHGSFTQWYNPTKDGGYITYSKLKPDESLEDRLKAESTKSFKNMGSKTIGGFEAALGQSVQIVGMQNNIQLRSDIVYIKTSKGVSVISFTAKEKMFNVLEPHALEVLNSLIKN